MIQMHLWHPLTTHAHGVDHSISPPPPGACDPCFVHQKGDEKLVPQQDPWTPVRHARVRFAGTCFRALQSAFGQIGPVWAARHQPRGWNRKNLVQEQKEDATFYAQGLLFFCNPSLHQCSRMTEWVLVCVVNGTQQSMGDSRPVMSDACYNIKFHREGLQLPLLLRLGGPP